MNDKKFNLLPIGSLITYKEIPLVICGYALVENEIIVPSYRVVNMPLGFIDKDSVKTIPVNGEISVVKEGYRNDIFDVYIKQQNHKFEVLNGLTDTKNEDINNDSDIENETQNDLNNNSSNSKTEKKKKTTISNNDQVTIDSVVDNGKVLSIKTAKVSKYIHSKQCNTNWLSYIL